MPHVVLEGAVDAEAIRLAFRPQFHRAGEEIVRVEELYVQRDGAELLFDVLVVEGRHRQRFFVQLLRREAGGGTVRLLPQTDPEKTPGVKRAVGIVAGFVRDLRPGACRFGATNIGDYLPAPPAAD